MPTIAVIYHPGGEPSIPKNKCCHITEWNSLNKSKAHKRKFLLSKGKYVCSINVTSESQDCLTFWGEWEAQSLALKINTSGKCNCPCGCQKLPQYLHLPFLDTNVPNYPNNLHSTDPFVFDDPFIYFFCNQGKSSTLRSLSPLSLVLFGSGFNGAFHLDTLLVISDNQIQYNSSSQPPSNVSKSFIDASWQPVIDFLRRQRNTNQYTLYKGVNFQQRNNYNEIFSFVPVKKFNQNNLADSIFCRPQIVLNGIISQRQPQGIKITNNINNIVNVWQQIVQQVLNQGLCLGTYFEPPRNIPTNNINACINNKQSLSNFFNCTPAQQWLNTCCNHNEN